MFKDDPLFEPPKGNPTIWHYMDFIKFLSLLDSSSIFFRRASKLKDMDPREGYFSIPDIELLEDKKWQLANKNLILKNSLQGNNEITEVELDKIAKLKKEELDKLAYNTRENFNKCMGINCWHLSEYESMAMWKIYGESIAIKSTYNNLKNAFVDEHTSTHIGIVVYKDYSSEITRKDIEEYIEILTNPYEDLLKTYWNYFIPLLLHKRNCFEYEKELRAITPINNHLPEEIVSDGGVRARVNLETLIQEIIISPRAEDWVKDLVNSLIKKYKPQWNIQATKSKLLDIV